MGREKHAMKTALMAAVSEKRDSMKCVIDLCDFMVESLRELNDTAAGTEILQNQGGIMAYKFIIDVILNMRSNAITPSQR